MGTFVLFLHTEAVEKEIVFVVSAPAADVAEAGGLECNQQSNVPC